MSERVASTGAPVLLTGAGVLARHGCVDLLKPLAAFATRREHAVWLLAPQPSATPTPSLDGAALPLETPQQWLLLPGRWAAESTVPATA